MMVVVSMIKERPLASLAMTNLATGAEPARATFVNLLHSEIEGTEYVWVMIWIRQGCGAHWARERATH